MRDMSSARFGFESDRELAMARLFDFEWVIKTAVEQARLDPAVHGSNPRRTPQLLMNASAQPAWARADAAIELDATAA